ncbi:molybdopterin-binding domain of aldehyde dehydrogenase domain-containing protein [Phthorimaea operculella]|nr:molybdopterin-binding domain of aldehyde dehydrogenase domain-containing protein [Phthorimaea operculella]
MRPLHINRNIRVPVSAKVVQLIGYADASSETAYGCCVYLRVVDESGKTSISLLCSKSRINPRNKNALSVPRLELNAMLLLTRLVNRVHDTLSLKINIQDVYLFSDSQISLAWLATEPMKLSAYVANKVRLIREETYRWRWLYVSSEQNPADIVSRGTDPDELIGCSLWWQGPECLRDSEYNFEQKFALPPVGDLPECLVLVFSCNGWAVTTIEGLGNRRDGYDDIQKRVAAFNATQCGYCTPGWIMHLNSLRDKNLTMAQMERSFGSNTCRCTGFRPIMDTVKSFAADCSPSLCKKVQDMEDLFCDKTKKICERKYSVKSFDSDWSVLSHLSLEEDAIIEMDFGNSQFYKVYSIAEIFSVLNKCGIDSYMLVDGNTSKGIFENFEYPRVLIDISEIKSLKMFSFDQNLVLGANISIEDCITIFTDTASMKYDEFGYLHEFAKHLELIAHIPVRKIGSLAGNLMAKHMMPSYPSDLFLLFTAVGATLTVRQKNGTNATLTMLDFLKYDMRGVLILNIELPPMSKSHIFRSYKIMPRHQNALAIVNAAFLLKLTDNDIVAEISIVFGNICADFNHASATEKYLKGKKLFTNETLQGAIKMLNAEIDPALKPPEPSPECRKKLAIGLFYKFVLNISPQGTASPRIKSGGDLLDRPLSKGSQNFQTDKTLYPLNEPVPKYEAIIQSSGEAQYANDIPPLPREVFGAFVLSTVHSGQIAEIATDVLNIKGVLALYTAKDIPGKNSFTAVGLQLIVEEEELLATTDIKFYGQPVAIVVAESEALAKSVAKKVNVIYKNTSTKPPVLSIDEAKKESTRYEPSTADDTIIKPKGKGDNTTKVIKGTYQVEAQYHYYLEPITSVVVPVDKGLEVYDSSQWLDLTQTAIAKCLGISESQVMVYVRRIGGGFGGKITRNSQGATACALIAFKLSRPCRFILPIQTNMTIAGRRLPCQCDYEVGVDDDGKIQYLNASIVEDFGCSNNDNILSYTAGGFPNCYNTDFFSLQTAYVRTDLPSNSYARAPGTSEGIACIEHIMEHIAFTVGKDATAVRLANMRTEDNDLPQLIEEYKKDCDYDNRIDEIEKFNKVNRWQKRAIKIAVMSFPVEYYGNYSALVSIYRGDGTVTVTTGGVEMGQGVNTKAQQVCAYELGIPLEDVSILPMYSFVSANNVFSGSSIVSESVCYSIIRACDILKQRLQPIKDKMTNPTWKELIKKAGEELIDLTASYMMTNKEKDLSSYNAYTVTILETELDVLTGRYEILRADILEDVGLSTNPTIDVGQVEGAFVQGLGYYTSEKLVYDEKTGKLLTNRSLNYHVPLCLDIPADFRVKFRYNEKNKKGVLGSKAVGEMGICTANVITHALRQCILESRKEFGYDTTEWLDINIPYDTESILTALNVKLEEMVLQ